MSIEIESIFEKRINALEGAAHAEWPGDRRALQPEHFLDFVEQFQRRPAFAVELVDESDDRRVAQPADFHQLDRARFDTLGGVDHHQRRVNRRQRPIRVFGKILVSRCVEQVDDLVVIRELHHRGGDRDSALLFERSEEHTSELQSLMRISYAVFCLKKKTKIQYMSTVNICTFMNTPMNNECR